LTTPQEVNARPRNFTGLEHIPTSFRFKVRTTPTGMM
jgi:hypothetical protein